MSTHILQIYLKKKKWNKNILRSTSLFFSRTFISRKFMCLLIYFLRFMNCPRPKRLIFEFLNLNLLRHEQKYLCIKIKWIILFGSQNKSQLKRRKKKTNRLWVTWNCCSVLACGMKLLENIWNIFLLNYILRSLFTS